jgi:hypothetical protein
MLLKTGSSRLAIFVPLGETTLVFGEEIGAEFHRADLDLLD